MADVTIHGQTYTGVNAINYVKNGVTNSVNELVVNGSKIWEIESLLPAKNALSDMSWADISTVCKAGLASEYWNVGDTKPITINSVAYNVVLIDFDHDDVTDSTSYGRTKAGATFNLLEVTETNYTMASDAYTCNNWTLSTIRSSTLPTILSQLETDLQIVIVPVNKPYSIYNSKSITYDTTSDSLFLLSVPEVGGSDTTDGTLYSYFSTNDNRKKKYTDDETYKFWWLRTANKYSSGYQFARVTSGGVISYLTCTGSQRISFAFCV